MRAVYRVFSSLLLCALALLAHAAPPRPAIIPGANSHLRLYQQSLAHGTAVLNNRPASLKTMPGLLPAMSALPSGTSLSVRVHSGDLAQWVSTTYLDPSNTLKLTFKWDTKQLSAASAVWQVAVLPFAENNAEWQSPPGLVADGTIAAVPAKSGTQLFEVDFTPFMLLHRLELASQVKTKLPLPGQAASGAPGEATQLNPKAKLPVDKELAGAKIAPAQMHPQHGWAPLVQSPQGKMPAPDRLTYYVRLVTLDAKGKAVGVPSAPVTVIYQRYRGADIPIVDPKMQPVVHPKVTVVGYQPVQMEKPGACYRVVVTQNPFGNTFFGKNAFYVGQKLDLTPKKDDKSWWDEFTGAIGDFFDYVASAVNWVSNTYASIKTSIINLAVGMLGEWARGPLAMGLDLVLASAGIPPSLPNFDDLAEMGEGYLVASIADTAGVPPDVAQQVVDTLQDQAKSAANGGGDPKYWFKPDPDYQYSPAIFMVEISNPSPKTSDRVWVDASALGLTNTAIYQSQGLPIPQLKPGETLRVPMVVREALPADYRINPEHSSNYTALEQWWKAYNAGTMQVTLTTTYRPDLRYGDVPNRPGFTLPQGKRTLATKQAFGMP